MENVDLLSFQYTDLNYADYAVSDESLTWSEAERAVDSLITRLNGLRQSLEEEIVDSSLVFNISIDERLEKDSDDGLELSLLEAKESLLELSRLETKEELQLSDSIFYSPMQSSAIALATPGTNIDLFFSSMKKSYMGSNNATSVLGGFSNTEDSFRDKSTSYFESPLFSPVKMNISRDIASESQSNIVGIQIASKAEHVTAVLIMLYLILLSYLSLIVSRFCSQA